MKKITGISLIIILILYLILLPKYILIEEIIGIYLIPILLIVFISTLVYFLIRIFNTINYKRFIINSLIVSCILQIGIISLILWSASPRDFSRDDVIDDIDYAIRIMEDVHPNLYHNLSKDAFYLKADSIKQTLPEKITDAEAFKILRSTFSMIRDGHTGGGWNFFSNRGAGMLKRTLPYRIEIRNERLFVTKNYNYKNKIPIGSEIIRINEIPAYQCLQEVSKLISYEIIPFRNSMLETPMFWSLWNDFKSFELSYIAPESKSVNTIKASGGIISKLMFFQDNKPNKIDYSYKSLSSDIGYLEFNSFRNLNKFKIFLDSTFKVIQSNNIEDLIIDIRKNGGGNSTLGDELMQYISANDFRMFDSCLIKISDELNKKNYFDGMDSKKRVIGSVYNASDSSKTKLRENPLRFNGQSYLLVSGNTFSSATDFASSFQCYQVGKIIGTESGGLTACFGDVYSFILPNTKFDMGVSYKKFYNACGIDNKRGVIPDFIIENSFDDNQKGIDKVMEFTINLIKDNK